MGTFYANPSSVAYNTAAVELYDGSWATGGDALGNVKTFARDPSAPVTTSRLDPASTLGTTVFEMEDFVKSPLSTIVTLTVYLYAAQETSHGVTVDFITEGIVQQTVALTAGSTDATELWRSDWAWSPAAGLTNAELATLQIQITADNALDPPYLGFYLEIATTESSHTFTAVADNYGAADSAPWRPRIKPGAFWI
jgi:hypothetical protein